MRADAVLADRKRQVQLAARGWHEAKAIDEPTRAAIEQRFADDRARLGLAWRSLAFVFAFGASLALFGVVLLFVDGLLSRNNEPLLAALCLAYGVALAAATEILTGPMRRADSGVEAATALLAVWFVAGGLAWVIDQAVGLDGPEITLFLGLACVACALGAYRWGFAFLALFAAAAGYALLARLSGGRVWWILTSLVLAGPLMAGVDARRLAPSHRDCCRAVLLVAVVALYVAVHLGSLDERLIEVVADWKDSDAAWPEGLRTMSILATALMPIAVLIAGVLTRRTLMMRVGVMLGVASLVTLRFYVSVAPLWVVLLSSGTAALLFALGVRRLLASAPDRERGGFTAEPLFEDGERREAIEMISAAAALSPAARTVPADGGKVDPGGGGYGGGGAGDSY